MVRVLLAALVAAAATKQQAERGRGPQLPDSLSVLRRSFDRMRAMRAVSEPQIDVRDRVFLINGWHWHNMVVDLHLRRFVRALEREPSTPTSDLCFAWNYLWHFSAVSLWRIETQLLWPWLRANIPPSFQPALRRLWALADGAYAQGRRVSSLVQALDGRAGVPRASQQRALHSECLALQAKLRAKHAHEVGLVVPLVAAFVPKVEQERFNQQVLRRLGLLSSRLHLVGMADVVATVPATRGKGFLDGDQLDTFRKRIPSVARRMIPRWRRLLYEPRAGPILSA